MSDVIGALRVHMSVDNADLVKGFSTAEKKAATTATSIKKSMTGVKLAFAGLAAGISLGALTAVAKKALDYAASLGNVSQQLNVTTRDLQVFRYAAAQNGIAQAEMDNGLGNLATTLGKVAAGAKAPIAALKAIGIEAKDLAGLDTGSAFRKIADGLQKIGDRAERSAVSYALFGEAGKKLDVLLAGGSSRIDGLARAAEELGIVLSDEQIRNADQTANKLEAVKMVLEANIASAVSNNAASIIELANALAELVNWAGQAVAAWRSFKLEQQAVIAQGQADSWFATPQQRLAALQQVADIREEQLKLAPKSDEEKARDAAIARIMGNTGEIFGRSGSGRIGQFLAPPGRKGPRGKTAEQLERERQRAAEEALRRDQQFEADVNRAQQDILSARAQLSDDAGERAQLERERVNVANEQARAEILQDKDLTEARKAELLAYNDRLHLLDIDNINKRDQVRRDQEGANIVMDRLRLEQEILSGQADLAETQAERRRIELKILDAKYAELRHSLRQVTKENGASRDQVLAAQDLLTALPQKQANEAASIRRGTMGPLESYLNSLPNTAAKADEAFEAVAAGGISSIVDGLADAAVGARSLGDVFKNVARQIIADLIRIQIQKAIVGALSSALGGIGGGINTGALSSTMASNSAELSAGLPGAKMPGFATGGAFTIQGRRGVDTNLLSLNGVGIANVSHGERVAISPENGGGGGRVVVELNNDMLNARIVEGSVEVVRASAPGIVAGAKAATMRDLSRPRL